MALGLTAWDFVASAAPARVDPAPERLPQPLEPFPMPQRDAFYQSPPVAALAAAAPGAIFKIREVAPKAYFWFDVPARAWQLMFRSTDHRGRPVPSVTTVLVPYGAPPMGQPRVLLSYQTAYDGLTLSCAPSRSLVTGTQLEHLLIRRALKRGWIVSVPDYEGLQSWWGVAANSAHGVLDATRAALRFGPLGLSGNATRVGLVGYSGGALASAWAAELAPAYAPELNLVGVAAGGVPVDLGNVARKIDGRMFASLYFTMSVSLMRAYPEAQAERFLNARGKAVMARAGEMCAGQFLTGTPEALVAFPFKRMADHVTVPDLLAEPALKRIIDENRLGQRTPQAPLYIYQATHDPVMPLADVEQLVKSYCAAGARVVYKPTFGEHLLPAVTGFGGALAFLEDRFAAKPAPSTCVP